jgi:hypothetical protein
MRIGGDKDSFPFRLRFFRCPQQRYPGNLRVLLRNPFVEVLTLKFSELRGK